MNTYLKLSVAAITTALAALTLRRQTPDLAMLLGVFGCCVSAVAALSLLQPVLDFVQLLYEKTGLEQTLLTPLLKTAGVGILTQIAAAICADAGQSALAKLVELGGTVLCISVGLPLLSALLKLIQQLAGAGA